MDSGTIIHPIAPTMEPRRPSRRRDFLLSSSDLLACNWKNALTAATKRPIRTMLIQNDPLCNGSAVESISARVRLQKNGYLDRIRLIILRSRLDPFSLDYRVPQNRKKRLMHRLEFRENSLLHHLQCLLAHN
jgi:hypothetical protein